MWKIGNVQIENKIVLAPLSGIGNSAFRKIAKHFGVGLIYAEMVSDKAIAYGSEKTIDMLYMEEEERPIAQQIFGSDLTSFVESAKFIERTMKPDIIDINMGCPVPKVALKAQAGSALLKDPDKVYEIVSTVVASVNVPVTVKIRSGWDEKHINAKEIAMICEKAGASAITIHPRTRNQGYSGHSDWSVIKEVKESVSIPVIGNGDVKTCYDAKRMLEETNCDAVMIGRASLGNPWVFKECLDYLEKGLIPKEITIKEKLTVLLEQFDYLLKIKPEKLALLEIRSHALWYVKGYNNCNELKKQIMQVKTKEEFINLIKENLNE